MPEEQGNENEAVAVQEEDTGSGEPTEDSKNSASGIDLKGTLVLVVVGAIAIGSAFIFLTRVYSAKDAYDVTSSVDTSTAVTDDLKADTQNMEVSGKEAGNGKNKEKDADGGGDQKSNSVLGKILVPMESIVVNLGKVDSKRYLRVIISLEVNSGETEQTIKDNKVIFRDKLLTYLSSKGLNEISTQDSQFKLRTDIKNILNVELLDSDDAITNIYFSDFIIQ